MGIPVTRFFSKLEFIVACVNAFYLIVKLSGCNHWSVAWFILVSSKFVLLPAILSLLLNSQLPFYENSFHWEVLLFFFRTFASEQWISLKNVNILCYKQQQKVHNKKEEESVRDIVAPRWLSG